MRRPFSARPVDHRQLAREIVAELKSSEPVRPVAPTLDEFTPAFISKYVRANRQKPSSLASKEGILRNHLSPRFGKTPLNLITDESVQLLKVDLFEHNPKTVNNILSVLNRLLKVAAKWGVIERSPVSIDFLKGDDSEVGFYEFKQYAQLVSAAKRLDQRIHVMVLLGGDAGLRLSELIAVDPRDVDFRRNLLTVRRQDYKGTIISTKGRRARRVPMTKALCAAIRSLGRVEGRRLLTRDNGSPCSIQVARTWMGWAQRAAGLPETGALHVLRHTFCSHLAMRGATPLAIKELAGHKSMRTTMRYLHLSPTERDNAIRLLDSGRLGDIVSTTAQGGTAKGDTNG